MSATARRVVITGLGVICPLGDTPEVLFEALSAGRSGVGPLTMLPPDSVPLRFAAEAGCFTGDADNYGPLDKELKKTIRKAQKVMCREIQMGVAAAQRALHHSGLVPGPKFNPERTGIVFGSDYMLTSPEEFTSGVAACMNSAGEFEYARWATDAFAKLYPLWLLKYLPNMPAAHVTIFNDLRGPNNSVTQREASSHLALGEAFRTITRNHADVMVTGATGTRIHTMKTIHAIQTEELAEADDPTRAARPFDRDRTGMVIGEGAGSTVIETLDHAVARGATPLAEVLGHASATVCSRERVADRGRALQLVIEGCLRDAGLKPEQVGSIHAHGLGTRTCDAAEAAAIRTVFGTNKVPVTAAKSAFGNLGAGSGMVELVAAVMALRAGSLFPIQNYTTPDPEAAIHAVTDNSMPAGDTALLLSVTPQGQAAGTLIGRVR